MCIARPARASERSPSCIEFAGRPVRSGAGPKVPGAVLAGSESADTRSSPAAGCTGFPTRGGALPWTSVVEYERAESAPGGARRRCFEKKLIDNMHDGVVFVDSQSTITLWNTGVERLTGVSGVAACGRTFLPSLMDMCNNREQRIPNEDCPVAHAISDGRAVAGPREHHGPPGPACGGRSACDSRPRQRWRGARRHGAAARCIVGNLAGGKVPGPARPSRERPDDASCEPGRVRPDAQQFRGRPPGVEFAVQPDHVRHRSLQIDQRHARPPGRRQGDHHVRFAAEVDVPLGRPRSPLRRRGICGAVRRLHELGRGPESRRQFAKRSPKSSIRASKTNQSPPALA